MKSNQRWIFPILILLALSIYINLPNHPGIHIGDYHKATQRGERAKGENTCYFWFLYHGSPGAKVRSIIAELRSAENGLNAKIAVICDFVL